MITVLDCCYSGAAEAKGTQEDVSKSARASIDRTFDEAEGRCVLASSLGDQESFKMRGQEFSTFTYFLCEGLNGGNGESVDENGYVTIGKLSSYINRRMSQYDKDKQKPITKTKMSGEIELGYYKEYDLTKQRAKQREALPDTFYFPKLPSDMTFELDGKLTENSGNPLYAYKIKAYDKEPVFGVFGDDPIASAITQDDGSFKIKFGIDDFKKPLEFWTSDEPNLYMKIFDSIGNLVRETAPITVPFERLNNPEEEKYEVAVVGSGFGGTIVSLSLVNKFESEDKNLDDSLKRKVCILERGQWWLSHESPPNIKFYELRKKFDPEKGMLEYLNDNDLPFSTWSYPNNVRGLGQLLNNVRIINRRGLYDYRISKKVHSISASGVGGGSLIYANVTEKPDDSVIDAWKNRLGLGIDSLDLSEYFEMAKGFVGINKITTTSGLGTYKLPKVKAFQEAAEQIKLNHPAIVKNQSSIRRENADQDAFVEDIYAADLSITDIPSRKDIRNPFNVKNTFSTILSSIQLDGATQEEIAVLLRKYSSESNVCQRQGRCVLGCIPEARHTNSEKIFDYLNNPLKKKHFEVKTLCEVYDIEPLVKDSYNYMLYYTDFGDKKWKQADFNWNIGTLSFRLQVRLTRLLEKGRPQTLKCKKLILAAGAIGSTETLLKSVNTTRTKGQKLDLSNRLGKGYSMNGNLLGAITATKINIHATRGPTVTSAIKIKEGEDILYTIEDSSIPKMFAGVSRFLSDSRSFRNLLGLLGLGAANNVVI